MWREEKKKIGVEGKEKIMLELGEKKDTYWGGVERITILE